MSVPGSWAMAYATGRAWTLFVQSFGQSVRPAVQPQDGDDGLSVDNRAVDDHVVCLIQRKETHFRTWRFRTELATVGRRQSCGQKQRRMLVGETWRIDETRELAEPFRFESRFFA